jgi:hypothetical protein
MMKMNKLIVAGTLVLLMAGPSLAVGIDVHQPGEVIAGHLGSTATSGQDIGYQSGYIEQPTMVPLPAAGWMLLAGLGGLVAMRRRARA